MVAHTMLLCELDATTAVTGRFVRIYSTTGEDRLGNMGRMETDGLNLRCKAVPTFKTGKRKCSRQPASLIKFQLMEGNRDLPFWDFCLILTMGAWLLPYRLAIARSRKRERECYSAMTSKVSIRSLTMARLGLKKGPRTSCGLRQALPITNFIDFTSLRIPLSIAHRVFSPYVRILVRLLCHAASEGL